MDLCWQSNVRFQGKPFNIMVIQVYVPTSNAEEAEAERFYEDLQDLLELNTPKRCPFHDSGLECKSRKLRNTWSNRQILPWSTEWSRAKANRVLPRERTGHSKHPLPTTEDSAHGHHQMANTEIQTQDVSKIFTNRKNVSAEKWKLVQIRKIRINLKVNISLRKCN